jgi:hypothetical protein
MFTHHKKSALLLALSLLAGGARADLTIGVSIPLTGPGSALGIPVSNEIKLWPAAIAGQKLKLIVLDYSKTDHWGFAADTGVMLKVVNGQWQVD